MIKLKKTRIPGLGYSKENYNQWRFYDLISPKELDIPSVGVAIGGIYKSEDELLADVQRFAEERGYLETPPKGILHKEFSYKQIEDFANEGGYELHESGIGETVGRHIITLDHPDRDIVITYILVGGSSQGFIYKCVYSDIDKERYAKGGRFKKCPVGTEVQTLIFDKEYFSEATAKSWAKQNGFKYGDVDEKENTYRLRQQEPDEFRKDSFRTIEFTKGLKSVIGCPVEKMDEGGVFAFGGETDSIISSETLKKMLKRTDWSLGLREEIRVLGKTYLCEKILFRPEYRIISIC